MIMEEFIKEWRRFIQSQRCVFDLQAIDFPSPLQQHMITSHYELAHIIRTTPHPDIVKILHSNSDKTNHIFLPGLTYHVLLGSELVPILCDTYLPILTADTWTALDRLLQNIIRDTFRYIKRPYRPGIPELVEKIHHYGQLSSELLSLIVKTINCYRHEKEILDYNACCLRLLGVMMKQKLTADLQHTLSVYLFYKLLRLLVLMPTNQYDIRNDYVSMATKLLEQDPQNCLGMGAITLNHLQALQDDPRTASLLKKCRQLCLNKAATQQGLLVTTSRLAVVLSIKIEATTNFILQQCLSKAETDMQLNWVMGRPEQTHQMLVLDMLRYMLSLPTQSTPLESVMYVLDWLLHRASKHHVFLEQFKQELFCPCFINPSPFPFAPQRAMQFLGYLLHHNFDYGQNILAYLLKEANKGEQAKVVRDLFLHACSSGIIDGRHLLSFSQLNIRVKQDLQNLLGKLGSKFRQELRSSQESREFYDPLQQTMRKQSEVSVEFSDNEDSPDMAEHHKMQSSHEHVEVIESQDEEMGQQQEQYAVNLEKIYVQEMGQCLQNVLRDPDLANYKTFLKNFIDTSRALKVKKQNDQARVLLNESAKVTYLMFQSHFQNHREPVDRDESVIYYLLNIVVMEWGNNSFTGECCKKLLTRIMELSPTAEPGIWRQFLLYFRKGATAYVKNAKEWLFPKEKADYALALLNSLAPLPEKLVENAQHFRVPSA